MPAPPGLLLILNIVLSVGLVVVSLVVGLAWARLRSLESQASRRAPDELDRRLQALEELVQSATRPDEPQSKPARRHPGPPVVRITGATLRADAGEPSAVSGPTLIAVPKLSASAPSQATATVTRELGRRFGPIWEMADAGESADAIARSTGQPIGQIELILALRRQSMAAADGLRPT